MATVEAARASLQAAQANQVKAEKDAARHEALYAEVSVILNTLDPSLLASLPRLGERHDPNRAEAALAALRRRGG